MKYKLSVLFLIIAFCFLALIPALQADQSKEGSTLDSALTSAQKWLNLSDEGQYAESWDQAAQFFKAAVTKNQWIAQLEMVRKPMGKLIRRKVISRQYTKTLPGAPDGEYVVIQFETSFEHKKSAIETVTPMLDKDGKWRVSGYYIR